MKVLKIFLRLKAKEIWADGLTIKIITGVAIWYYSGVWLFGEYIVKPYIDSEYPLTGNTIYGIEDKYIGAPLILLCLIGICFLIGLGVYNAGEWLRNNWREAQRIAREEDNENNL